MSTPHVAGVFGLLRSINPLLTQAEIRDVLTSTASRAGSRTDQLGFGVPDARSAVHRVLGRARGVLLPNRLTPLFSLYSPEAQAHVYTTFPSTASSFYFNPDVFFQTVGPAVAGYTDFPDATCQVSPCDSEPRASVHLFVSDAAPFQGAPPLVPLYRLRYDPRISRSCGPEPPPPGFNRAFTYTTEEAGILYFKENVVDSDGIGYELDGIEGYLFARCDDEPSCIPEGAERLYRFYHPIRDDWAIFPERELAQKQAEGYRLSSTWPLHPHIGYVYPNVDSDGDTLIDGFETLLGTDSAQVDTDCDGIGDGDEILRYDGSDPELSQHGYRDPLDGPCIRIFSDDLESGDLARWSQEVP